MVPCNTQKDMTGDIQIIDREAIEYADANASRKRSKQIYRSRIQFSCKR